MEGGKAAILVPVPCYQCQLSPYFLPEQTMGHLPLPPLLLLTLPLLAPCGCYIVARTVGISSAILGVWDTVTQLTKGVAGVVEEVEGGFNEIKGQEGQQLVVGEGEEQEMLVGDGVGQELLVEELEEPDIIVKEDDVVAEEVEEENVKDDILDDQEGQEVEAEEEQEVVLLEEEAVEGVGQHVVNVVVNVNVVNKPGSMKEEDEVEEEVGPGEVEEEVGPGEVAAPERNKTSTTGGKLAVGIFDTLQVPVETAVVGSLHSDVTIA